MAKYWFAHVVPPGNGQFRIAPISWIGWAALAIWVTVCVVAINVVVQLMVGAGAPIWAWVVVLVVGILATVFGFAALAWRKTAPYGEHFGRDA